MKLAALALAVTAAVSTPAAAEPTPVTGACDLLTTPEVGAYFGTPLTEKQARGAPKGSQCEWHDEKAAHFLTVELFTNPGNAFSHPGATKLLGLHPVELPGVGDRAVRRADGTVFLILAHGKLATIWLQDLGAAPDRSARALDFAKTIAARL